MSDPTSDRHPHSPTTRQHESGIPLSPRSPPAPATVAAASPGGGPSNVSSTRYSLRFVTSSPGTSPTKRPNRSPSADGADTSVCGDDAVDGQNDLHGESIAYDLSGLAVQQSPLLGDSFPVCKSGGSGSGGISSSPTYVIRPRKFSSGGMLSSPRGTAADYSPNNSSDDGIEEALEAARKRTEGVATNLSSPAANNQGVYDFITPSETPSAFLDPFSGAPGLPPLTPMTDAVELTPTVEVAVKAARKVTDDATGGRSDGVRTKSRMIDPTGRAIDSKGDVWASAAFRSIVDSADCILAAEHGDRNYLKQRYEDAIECYEEGLEMAYSSLHNMTKQSRTSASSSSVLDDDIPSDEEGGPPEEKDFEDENPLKPNASFLMRIGSGTSIDADQSDVVLIAFASIYLRKGNAFFRMGEWNEARRSYHDSKGYLLLMKPASSSGSEKDPSTANRAAMLSKTKMGGMIMNNLAAIEASTGRHQHATTEYAEALRVKRRSLRSLLKQDKEVLDSTLLSKEDAVLDITTTLTNIGQLRQKIAKHGKAEEAYKQALSLRVEKCGERDLSVVSNFP